MKKQEFTLIKSFAAAVFVASMAFVSCKEEPKTTVIIAKKPAKTVKKGIQKVGDYTQTRTVEWLGDTYSVTVERKADTSLPLIVDETGGKYYDNAITVTVKRPDGTAFFNRRFTKSDFTNYIGQEEGKGALLGIVLDYAQAATLYFAASVGSPDMMSDEYVPLIMSIGRGGAVSIKKDTRLDTVSDDANDEV